MFDPVSNKVKFPELEEEILRFWEEQQIFEKSLEQRKGGEEFVFYDGPPFATGLPHYGHLLAGTIKDIVPRYQTMRGKYVERRFGWDCHGLPIEALAQDALGLAGTAAIVEKGVDVFNEQCRSMVQTYVGEWRKTVNRMGRWVDFDNDYKTMDPTFMETIWWVFKQIWDQGRIYKSYRIMPYSWKLTTPLSNFEANSNYKMVQDPAVTIRMKVQDAPVDGDVYILIWTTTPWTLPANLAACVGADLDYVAVRDVAEDVVYLLAEARVSSYYPKEEQFEIVKRFKGADLVGLSYEPIFPYYAGHEKSFTVVQDDYVTTEDGTGIVHIAPAYGEDDYRIGKALGIELVDPLDVEARFTDAVPDFAGQHCKEADKGIIRWLKDAGKLVHQATIDHSYPFCERTDTPLIYRAIDAWYIRVEDITDRMVKHNNTIHWMPKYVGEGRFGNWLKDAKDWNISRNRFWGSCMPLWISEDGEDMMCFGSVAELEAASGVKVDDLHKHILDEVTFEKDGKTYRRTPEVLDCWFESGAMPYAQQHYPFENKEKLEANFPADFIAEGLDQTRGWFYTLTVLSTLLFDRPAFKNVVVNGMILAENGEKMSKRLKNYPPPEEIISEMGADALRLYLISSPVVRGEPVKFSKGGVQEILRSLLIPWWNSYSFFVTYANIDKWEPGEHSPRVHLLDRWIMSSTERLSEQVTAAMDQYDLQASVRPFIEFIGDLTNWYIRRSRRRFWKSDDDADKAQAYETLYEVLLRLSKIAAPFVPFISEMIYRNLRRGDMPESVHLCDFPSGDHDARDIELEKQVELGKSVVSMGRGLRTEYQLKVRQPLKGIHVATRDLTILRNIDELSAGICDELNVKEVWFNEDETALATLTAKANFRALGPRFGKQMKAVGAAVAGMSGDELEALARGESVEIDLDGATHSLGPDDVLIERLPREGLAVASEGPVVVALETELDDTLIKEGLAREVISKIQQMRKEAGLEVTDRIGVRYVSGEEVAAAIQQHESYIMAEILALSMKKIDAEIDTEEWAKWDVNSYDCAICIEVKTS